MYDTSRLKDLAISETGFIFDPMSGATFTANAAAVCIIHALREGRRRGEIIARLKNAFSTDHADLDSDLGEFIRLLVQQGILPHDFSLEPLDDGKPQKSGDQSNKNGKHGKES
jgi:hypothetical protein